MHDFQAHRSKDGEALRFDPSGTRLATGAGYPDSSLKLWDVQTGVLLARQGGWQVLDVGFAPDGQTLYVCDRQQDQPRVVPVAKLPEP
jgi:WD40 repeat protein